MNYRYILLLTPLFTGCGAVPALIVETLVQQSFAECVQEISEKSDKTDTNGKCNNRETDIRKTMRANILCLDLGTQMGWAMRDSDGRVTSGSVNLKGDRFSGVGMRFLNFQQWLDHKLFDQVIDCVYFESVKRHLGTDAAHCYGGFAATLMAWCESHRIPYKGIGVGIWKKATCGNGRATKQDVIEKVRTLGYDPADDNEADALGVMLCV